MTQIYVGFFIEGMYISKITFLNHKAPTFVSIVLVKKLEIEKTKTTKYTTFKTDTIKVVLVFSISNFFTNENSQERKLSAV